MGVKIYEELKNLQALIQKKHRIHPIHYACILSDAIHSLRSLAQAGANDLLISFA